MSVNFRPVDLQDAADSALALAYRHDVSHLRDVDVVFPTQDQETTLNHFKRIQAISSKNMAFAILNDEIIGVIECGRKQSDVGYVHFIFVIERLRGKGFGSQFLTEAELRLKRQGFTQAQLSSIAALEKNTRFYEKSGWKQLGLRADKPHSILWEKQLNA